MKIINEKTKMEKTNSKGKSKKEIAKNKENKFCPARAGLIFKF
jgi:hypothetical protein